MMPKLYLKIDESEEFRWTMKTDCWIRLDVLRARARDFSFEPLLEAHAFTYRIACVIKSVLSLHRFLWIVCIWPYLQNGTELISSFPISLRLLEGRIRGHPYLLSVERTFSLSSQGTLTWYLPGPGAIVLNTFSLFYVLTLMEYLLPTNGSTNSGLGL